MKKGLKFLVVLLFGVGFLAATHSALHLYAFGTGVSGILENGVSGFSVGKFSVGEEKTGDYSLDFSLSQFLVIGEWSIVLVLFLFFYVRNKLDFKREVMDVNSFKGKSHLKNGTDLDRLYHALQGIKRIRFKAVEKSFGVDREVAEDWARMLESGKLAMIEYPRIGGPEIVLIDESKEKKSEKEVKHGEEKAEKAKKQKK